MLDKKHPKTKGLSQSSDFTNYDPIKKQKDTKDIEEFTIEEHYKKSNNESVEIYTKRQME